MAKEPKNGQSGKGGNFDTRANPFTRDVERKDPPSFQLCKAMLAAVDMTVKAGCAVMFGSTRDGGAVVVTILDGEHRHRTYCSNEGELEDAAQAMLQMYSF